MDEYDKTNQQMLAHEERDTPSKLFLFQCQNTLSQAHRVQREWAHVIDNLWHLRLQLQENDEFYDNVREQLLNDSAEEAPQLGQSLLEFSLPNQNRANSLPIIKVTYNHGELHLPILRNVDLAFLQLKLSAPQHTWSTGDDAHCVDGAANNTNTDAQNTFEQALQHVLAVCRADASTTSITRLLHLINATFLQDGQKTDSTATILIEWAEHAVLHFQQVDEGDISMDQVEEEL
jgi:hypothetical protein